MAKRKSSLVFEGSSIEAELIQNILKDSGIATLMKDKMMGQLFPFFSPAAVYPVKIFVDTDNFDRAIEIIKIYIIDPYHKQP